MEKGGPLNHVWWLRIQTDIPTWKGPLLGVWGSQSQPGFPAQSTRAGKRSPHNIWLWKSVKIMSTRDMCESAGNPGALLKGQHTRFLSQPFTLGSGGGRAAQSKLESCEERLGCVAPEKELKGQAPGVPVLTLSPPPPANTIFLG